MYKSLITKTEQPALISPESKVYTWKSKKNMQLIFIVYLYGFISSYLKNDTLNTTDHSNDTFLRRSS